MTHCLLFVSCRHWKYDTAVMSEIKYFISSSLIGELNVLFPFPHFHLLTVFMLTEMSLFLTFHLLSPLGPGSRITPPLPSTAWGESFGRTSVSPRLSPPPPGGLWEDIPFLPAWEDLGGHLSLLHCFLRHQEDSERTSLSPPLSPPPPGGLWEDIFLSSTVSSATRTLGYRSPVSRLLDSSLVSGWWSLLVSSFY